MIKTVIMGTGGMGSLIRTTARALSTPLESPFLTSSPRSASTCPSSRAHLAADVIIDFSNVVTFDAVVAYVERTGAALVSGTTGYTPEQMDRLRELGQNARVMHSGNYSIGIAALRHLVAQARASCPALTAKSSRRTTTKRLTPPAALPSYRSTPSSK